MIVLGLNDHIWKTAYANMWTGKISDISGLIFFPLLLEYILPSRRGAVLCTGLVFTLLNTNEVFNQLWKDTFQIIYDSIGRERLAHSYGYYRPICFDSLIYSVVHYSKKGVLSEHTKDI